MKTAILFTAISICVAGAARGAIAADSTALEAAFRICAAIASDADRLPCYDHLRDQIVADVSSPSSAESSVEPEATPGDTGQWIVKSDTNPVDDTRTETIGLVATEGQGTFGEAVVFVARCMSNKTEAYINWNGYLASDSGDFDSNWKNVTIRIGDQKAVVQQWTTSTDEKATFAPEWPGDLLKKMAAYDKFVAVVTPYNESPITAVFDTKGMKAALEGITKTCNWPPG